MPQVPKYQPQVREAGFPNEKLSSNADLSVFGGGQSVAQVNQATQGVAKDIIDYQKEQLDKANKLRIYEGRRALNDWEIKNIHDPQTGAINRRGKNALGVNDELAKSYDELVKNYEDTLANDDQKMAFKEMAQARRESVMRWANEHVAKQTEVVEDEEFQASLESSKERASLDPRNVAIESDFIKRTVLERAQRKGEKEGTIQQALQYHESDLHARVIGGMLAKDNDLGAKAYLEKIRVRLDPDVARKLDDTLAPLILRGESQRLAKLIFQQSQGYGDAMERVDKISHPEKQDQVRARVKTYFQEQAVEQENQQNALYNQAYKILKETNNIDAISHQLLGALTPENRDKLERIAKSDGTYDQAFYYGLLRDMSDPAKQEKAKNINLQMYADKLGPHLIEMEKMQAELLAKGSSKDLNNFRSNHQILNDTMSEIGIDVTPKAGSQNAKNVNRIRSDFDAELKLFRQNFGREPKSDEVQSIADKIMVSGVVKGSGVNIPFFGTVFQTSKRRFELAPGEELSASFDSLPDREKVLLERALKDQGIPATTENMIKLWKTKAGVNYGK